MRLKRRQHYIDSTVQGALLRRILCHWLAFFVVACLSVVVMQTLLGDPNESVMTRLKKESGEFILLGVILLSLFPAFLLDTVRFSNRFVGPIARLRRGLRELGENREAEKMIFRDSDFWTDVAGEYNQVREIIQSQSEEIEKLKRKLEAAPVE